jgi:hypothetical protein
VSDAGDIAVGGGEGAVARYLRQGDRLGSGTAIDVRFGGEPVEVTALSLGDHRLAAGLDPVTGADPASDATPGGRSSGTSATGRADRVPGRPASRRRGGPARVGRRAAGRGRPDDPAGPVTVQVAEAATRRRLGGRSAV